MELSYNYCINLNIVDMLLNQKDIDELAKMYIEMIDIIFELNNN